MDLFDWFKDCEVGFITRLFKFEHCKVEALEHTEPQWQWHSVKAFVRASRHWPSLSLMLCSFTNQVLAQLDLSRYRKESMAYKNDLDLVLKEID